MNKPLISIIVPIYNVEPYLRRCLDSIANQTYTNLEIILVDDGSTDKCGQICDEYASGDKRIIVIHKENGGLSDARNVGLDIAKGEFVLFVDSDDWIDTITCEKTIRLAIREQADIVCFGYYEVFPSAVQRLKRVDVGGEISKTEAVRRLIWGTGVAVWGKLYSRILFENIRFPKGRFFEDTAFTIRLYHLSKKIYLSNYNFYYYSLRKDSLSCNRITSKGLTDLLYLWKERLEFLKQYYPDYVDKQIALILREMLIGLEILKNTSEYNAFKKEYHAFVKDNKIRIKASTKYTKIVWLYYYLQPLAFLYIKIMLLYKRYLSRYYERRGL